MKKIARGYLLDLFLISLLFITIPLFFFKLGQSSLVSFDEAWYADIARNIIKTKDLIHLSWNGKIYTDHPPAGFWIIATSFKIFGISDYSARFSQALAGFLGIIFLYLLGKELFNRAVGLFSAISLTSANWFLFRARSGNLDSFLVMFFILTLYLAIKASKNSKFLAPFSISMSLLLLTKTLVPFTVIPALLFIFWKSKITRNPKFKFYLLMPFILFLIWFGIQIGYDANFTQHYFKIGLSGVEKSLAFVENLRLIKVYLHNGIGGWFWPGFFALTLGLATLKKKFIILFVFFVSFFLPFLFSGEGHIWHLIPLHPIMILSFFGFSYFILDKVTKSKRLSVVIIFAFFLYYYVPQIQKNWREYINIAAYVSDDAILSKEASRFSEKLYVDGDFVPTAVFYSDKQVGQIQRKAKQLKLLFSEENSFILITHQWRLDGEDIPPDAYEIIKEDRDKVLVVRK